MTCRGVEGRVERRRVTRMGTETTRRNAALGTDWAALLCWCSMSQMNWQEMNRTQAAAIGCTGKETQAAATGPEIVQGGGAYAMCDVTHTARMYGSCTAQIPLVLITVLQGTWSETDRASPRWTPWPSADRACTTTQSSTTLDACLHPARIWAPPLKGGCTR